MGNFFQQIGINCARDRAAIKLAAANYLSEKKLSSCEPFAYPSAPTDDEPCTSSKTQEPTTIQSISTTECVVCLDSHVSLNLIDLKLKFSINLNFNEFEIKIIFFSFFSAR